MGLMLTHAWQVARSKKNQDPGWYFAHTDGSLGANLHGQSYSSIR